MTNSSNPGMGENQSERTDTGVYLQISDDALADLVEIALRLEGIQVGDESSSQPGLLIADSTGYAELRDEKWRQAGKPIPQSRTLLLVADEFDIPEGIEYLIVPQHGNSHNLDPEFLVRKVREMLSGRRPSAEMNPVTGLPGAAAFEAELRERISTGERFGVVFADLNHFRSYNKAYSYSRGDSMLVAVGELMSSVLDKNPHPQNFIAHLGSDDFALITSENLAAILAEEIVDSFDEVVSSFYDVSDLSKGSVTVTDRRGKEIVYSIVTIALAVILSSRRALSHAAEAIDIAEELLAVLKSRDVTESCCIVERMSGK